MNSRERVMQSVNHRQPDRVPLDFGGHRSSGMAVQAYKNLRDYLGLPQSPIYLYDIVQQLAVIEDDVLDFAGSDTVQLGYLAYRDPSYWTDFRMHDGSVVLIPRHIRLHSYPNGDNYIAGNLHDEICIQKKGCLYFEQTCFPYADDEDNEEFDDLDEKLE